MQSLDDLEVGIMFWADRDHLAGIKALGVRCGQLGISGSTELDAAAVADWNTALNQEQFTVGTVVAAYNGESYTDVPTVERTVGFIPSATRLERERKLMRSATSRKHSAWEVSLVTSVSYPKIRTTPIMWSSGISSAALPITQPGTTRPSRLKLVGTPRRSCCGSSRMSTARMSASISIPPT